MLHEEDFDPYEILIALQHSVIEIARAHNGKAQELAQAREDIKNLQRTCNHLQNRIQRLEAYYDIK